MRIVKHLLSKTKTITEISVKTPLKFSLKELVESLGGYSISVSAELRKLKQGKFIDYKCTDRLHGEYHLKVWKKKITKESIEKMLVDADKRLASLAKPTSGHLLTRTFDVVRNTNLSKVHTELKKVEE